MIYQFSGCFCVEKYSVISKILYSIAGQLTILQYILPFDQIGVLGLSPVVKLFII